MKLWLSSKVEHDFLPNQSFQQPSCELYWESACSVSSLLTACPVWRLFLLREPVSSFSLSCRTSAVFQTCSLLCLHPLFPLSALDGEVNVPCVYSWRWGLDFETWHGCRVVCVASAGWQSNMEDVNYGPGSAGVPGERDFLFRPASALLLTLSLSSTGHVSSKDDQ